MLLQDMKNKVSIPSDTKKIKDVTTKIVKLLVDNNVSKSNIFDIRLSVEESVINAIEYGNKKDPKLTVDIEFSINKKEFEVSIEDQGRGFDYKALPDPTKEENILRFHGRGIYLIHSLMDKIEYNKKGNMVRLTKYLT